MESTLEVTNRIMSENEQKNVSLMTTMVSSSHEDAAHTLNPAQSPPRTSTEGENWKKQKRQTWKKPLQKPKRPLSAYNLFFQLERERIISGVGNQPVTAEDVAGISLQHKQKKEKRRHRKTHGKISFASLARTIADKWKKLDSATRDIFDERAAVERDRYRREIDEWNQCFKSFGRVTQVGSLGCQGESHAVVVDDVPESTLYNESAEKTPEAAQPKTQPPPIVVDDSACEVGFGSGYGIQTLPSFHRRRQMNGDFMQPRMEGMMAYNPEQLPPHGDEYMMPSFYSHDAIDYYEVADQAYNMAQMAFPMCRSRQIGPMGGMRRTPAAGMVGLRQHQLEMQQMQQQRLQMQMMPRMAMQRMTMQRMAMQRMAMPPTIPARSKLNGRLMMPMGMCPANRFNCGDMEQYEEQPLVTMPRAVEQGLAPPDLSPREQGYLDPVAAPQEELSIDPHQGLSSPSFEFPREEQYGLDDTFENA